MSNSNSIQAEYKTEVPEPWTKRTMDKLKKTFSGNTLLLLGLMVAVIVFGTANRVLFKLMLIPMVNYPFFTNQLTSFIYIPFFWPIVW